MDPYLSFLKPRSPKRTLRDMLVNYDKYDDEQTGDGVMTRSQVRSSNNSAPEPTLPQNSLASSVVEQVQDEPKNATSSVESHQSEGPLDEVKQISENDNHHSSSNLYHTQTLVAENEDLKAYIVQTHFRRMKNFV